MKAFILILLMFWGMNSFATPVNINKADAKTISESLKGIGIKKAEAIVQYRKDHGDFKTVDALDDVKGIGKKTIDNNRKDILLEDAAATPANTSGSTTEAPKSTPTETKSDKKAATDKK